MTIEIACKDAIFHFNKHHLIDPTTPPWTLKTGGKTYYVNHVECSLPWSTKETPDNASTKGAIKIKKALLIINDDNEAELRPLTNGDLSRIRAKKQNYARILISNRKDEIKEFLNHNSISHGKIVPISGSCGTSFDLIDIKNKSDMVLLSLSFNECYRILQSNEVYYKIYDDPELLARFDADDYYDDDDDDESEE